MELVRIYTITFITITVLVFLVTSSAIVVQKSSTSTRSPKADLIVVGTVPIGFVGRV